MKRIIPASILAFALLQPQAFAACETSKHAYQICMGFIKEMSGVGSEEKERFQRELLADIRSNVCTNEDNGKILILAGKQAVMTYIKLKEGRLTTADEVFRECFTASQSLK